MTIKSKNRILHSHGCHCTTKVAALQESRIIELSNYIINRELTNALELLERHGYSSELGLFVLASLQTGGVA